jgi:hypothetical protein
MSTITSAQAAQKAEAPARLKAKANKARQQAERATERDKHLEAFKAGIVDSDKSIRTATEHLVETMKFGCTQREAAAVGKSAAWINRLLKWAKGGDAAAGSFSEENKAKRARERVQSTEQPKPKSKSKSKSTSKSDEDQRRGIGGNHPPADGNDAESVEDSAARMRVKHAVNNLSADDKNSEQCLADFKDACDAFLHRLNADDLKVAQQFVIEFAAA